MVQMMFWISIGWFLGEEPAVKIFRGVSYMKDDTQKKTRKVLSLKLFV